jgi:fibronectin type 3 domain-containing protein
MGSGKAKGFVMSTSIKSPESVSQGAFCNRQFAICNLFGVVFLLVLLRPLRASCEDETWTYTVQVSATVQTSPPQITLQWEGDDPYGVLHWSIYRKAKDATSWNFITTLGTSITSWTDTSVGIGSTYEYEVVKTATNRTGYGYVFSGINAPLTENRGTCLLIVATNSTVGLSSELARLQSDLTGDGWFVIRHDVSSNQTPLSVRTVITNDYYADPANVNSVFLFGHVPILQSGPTLNYDGHQSRAMPADAFYGEMNNDWPTNLASSPGFLPSDVKLMVGRVDLANMPGNGAKVPWSSETELLRNYLNKDHNWRHKLVTVPRAALMGNQRGDESGEATAVSGYRNFEPLVGPGNTIEADVDFPTNRWVVMLNGSSYLWAYGCGAGQVAACSGLGTNDGSFYDCLSTDVVGLDAKAVFVMLFGSWFGEWDLTDDLMRSVLATQNLGLTCALAGRPHLFLHHMGLGETIGYGIRLSINNTTLYQNQINALTRGVYVALMGDPTLRMDQLAPPSSLTATPVGATVNLSWSASSDPVLGYHVYRATSAAGPFSRITGSLISQTSFSDSNLSPGSYTYMVRAVALQTTPSGTYYNPSQGVFANATVVALPPRMTILVAPIENTMSLTWNSQPGISYRVQFKSSMTQANWTELSGSIVATDSTTSWVDPAPMTDSQRFYRVVAP